MWFVLGRIENIAAWNRVKVEAYIELEGEAESGVEALACLTDPSLP